ncbi:MAG: methylenetetrahydrofolate reductase [Actinomycetota bacterium]|nr:methylenetetrahydrofolate reductase [Actinomycetota bacterium]
MRVTEHYDKSVEPLISYEIIPPRRGGSIDGILGIVEALLPFDPPFIDVTSHAAEAYFEEMPGNVVRRHVKRKRPGTIGLCAAIQYRYGIDAVPHILCQGYTREETEDALIELHYLGIRNVLAVRGDDIGHIKPERPDRSANVYASDLVAQIVRMNEGQYLEELVDARPTDFCIGVGGYPEKHVEAPNLGWDIANLKRKVEAGADYIVTQMFFDNRHFFRFVKLCREAGITVPIVPGLKILATTNHLQSLPRTFGAEIPEALADEVRGVDSNAKASDVGVAWAREQSIELLEAGVPGLHFYIMSTANHVVRVIEPLR